MGNTVKRYNLLISEIEGIYHDIARGMGLADSESMILYTMCDHGDPCPLSVITSCTGLRKQTINSALRKLEAEGAVHMESTQGRNKNVCFTEKGRQLAENTVKKIINAENEIFAEWSLEEQEKYLELTEKYAKRLRDKAEHF